MRIIAIKTLREFWVRSGRKDSEQPLRAWHAEVKKADWSSTKQIKEQYRSVSFVGNNRVVFNIGGNKYRLIVFIRFDSKTVYIRFIGTHKEYDKINASEV